MTLRLTRRQYADLYGPTAGDRVRLADTELLIRIERDLTVPGEEAKFGGGKVIRDGMGQSARATRGDDVLDTVITNAIVVDHWGIVKADIGIRDGRIVGIGKAGNPDIMAGVTKGNASAPGLLREQIEAGAVGLKLHEDWGTTPAAIDTALAVADEHDVQVAIHTDTLNEAGFVEDTIRSFKGRTIHTYHTEGAGGGHAPDILRVCGEPNCLPSSTNPTMPFTVNTMDEHLDMLMVCHHLNPSIPEDLAFAESRIRAETIAAEDVLHDLGAISMMSSDSQAMGRVGEVVLRTWQTAHKMKVQRGALPGDSAANDNQRIKRYVAKYTINPAIAHGLAEHVGSLEVGKLADLVVWKPAFFGVKPELVVKGGLIAWAAMGDPNASIPTPQPVLYRPMFGALGRARGSTSLTFVSAAALAADVPRRLGLTRRAVAVKRCRGLGKKDMIHNDALPRIEVDAETYEVRADGERLTCEPARVLPMAQRYFLF